jgi:polyvinyl alcohol dehydrogenase (cytochrome)
MDRVRDRSILRNCALLTLLAALPSAAAVSGEAVYQKRCAGCHDSGAERTPPRDALKQLSVSRILRTLDFGVMINIAYVLNREEREAVANYLGVEREDTPVPQQAYCADHTVNIGASPNPAWNGWSADLSNTRYTNAGGVTVGQVGKLKLKWAYGFEGDVSAFAAPTVLGHTLFVGSAGGTVQALSTDTGCVRMGIWRGGRNRTSGVEETARSARIHAIDGHRGCP